MAMLPLTNLGPTTPVAIAYLQRESVLPEHPRPDQYTLHSYVEDTEDGTQEEIVYTDHHVVWTQGDTVKRVFKFNHDNDQVEHALLTWFPVEKQPYTSSPSSGLPASQTSVPATRKVVHPQRTSSRDRALVILLDRKAHIYLSHGASHIVNIPFEIEKVHAAPRGILIQRKLSDPKPLPPTPLLPKAPPNSFWSSQREHVLHNPHQASVGHGSTSHNKEPSTLRLQDFAIRANPSPVDDLPRLFALVDPLADIGLVGLSRSAHDSDRQSLSQGSIEESIAFPEHEEILYLSSAGESPPDSNTPLEAFPLALTVNRIRRVYSLWQPSYLVPQPSPVTKATTIDLSPVGRSKRRSSFAPRLSTGGLTPIPRSRPKPEGSVHKHGDQLDADDNLTQAFEALDGTADEFDLVASIEQPFERQNKKSKTDRRTSSMMARAELSSQDQPAFAELARNPAGSQANFRANSRASQSFGSVGERTSFGRSRLSGRASVSGEIAHLSDVDEMTTIADSMGDDLDLLDLEESSSLNHAAFDGLKTELRLCHVASIPFINAFGDNKSALPPPCEAMKAFIASDISSASISSRNLSTIAINITFPATKLLAEIECNFRRINDQQKPGLGQGRAMLKCQTLPHIRVYRGVIDAMRISDGALARTICLMENNSGPQTSSTIMIDTLQKSEASKEFRFMTLATTVTLPAMARLAYRSSNATFSLYIGSPQLISFQLQLQPRTCLITSHLRAIQHTMKANGVMGIPLNTLWLFYKSGAAATHGIPFPSDWQALAMALFTMIISVVGFNTIGQTQSHTPIDDEAPLRKSRYLFGRSHYLPAWQSLRKQVVGDFNHLNRSTEVSECAHIAICFCQESAAVQALTRRLSQEPDGKVLSERFVASLIDACHVLHEEDCLNVLTQPDQNTGITLLAITDHISAWMGWDSSISVPPNNAHSYPRRGLSHWISSRIRDKNFDELPPTQLLSLSSNRAEVAEKQLHLEVQNLRDQFTPRRSIIAGILPRTSQLSSGRLVELMLSLGTNSRVLETLPESIAGLLRNLIRRAQSSPMAEWSSLPIFEIVGREDLSLLSYECSPQFRTSETESVSQNRDIESICRDVVKLTEAQTKPASLRKSALAESRTTLSLIYREDRRWLEASKLLNPLRVAVAAILPKPGCSEAEFLDEQKNLAQLIYKRTMAIPTGSAIINFSSHQPMLTEKIEIFPFNTTCNMQPSNNTVNADKSNFTEEKVSWAFFHAGVHAGLRIRADSQHIDTSWLVLNRPADLGNRHAGLLFALGLNGHLKSMAKWLAFKYLTPKHNMTSIGLLLGLSASNMGTMDSLVTRLLSVHVTRLLPPGAAELNLSPLTQTAGIMGVGLLYYNSQHRRMSEVMLSELENIGEDGSPDSSGAFRDEGYRLAAGFSLGLINLGKGRDAKTLHDMRLIERLLAVAKGSRTIDLVHVLDQATAGATMAIAIIFMKSQNARLANEIGIPMNIQQFDYIRPDILLLRTVASNLIMWNEIKPEPQWINNRVPMEYRGETAEDTLLRILKNKPLESSRLPIYNILAGLCWSIALKHAGQVPGSADALEILLRFFDMITRVLEHVDPGMLTFDELLTRDAMLRFQHLLALSMATVVAGSGNLAVLRRLRYLHGTIQADQTFGLHQACHMAIGVLFMGQGRYTFSTSDLAIASLLCAFYPLFPKDVLDNRAHLQALRHLWVFAAEPRCLMVMDLDKRQPVIAPIVVHLKDCTESSMEAPCLLPPIQLIQVVEIRSPEHWHVVLNFANNPSHLSAFIKHQTVALRRKDVLTRQPTAFGAEMMAARHFQDNNRLGRSRSKGSRKFGDNAFDWIFKCSAFSAAAISRAHTQLGLLGTRKGNARDSSDEDKDALMRTLLDARTTATDDALVLATDAWRSNDASRLEGLKLILDWAEVEHAAQADLPETWIRAEWIDGIKRLVAARLLKEARSTAVEGAGEAAEVMDTT